MGKGQRSKNNAALAKATVEEKKVKSGKLKAALISVAVVVVLLLLVGATIWNMASDQGWFDGNDVVMKTDNYSVNGGMFSYFFRESYMTVYNMYYSILGDSVSSYIDTSKSLKEQSFGSDGETWYDYILGQAKESVTEYLSLCELARENGVKLEKEDRQAIDDAIADIKSAAKTSGLSSTDDYIRYVFGKGVNEKKIRKALEIEQLAQKYVTQLTEAVDVSDEALEAAYKADPNSYDKVSYLTYAFKADDLIPEDDETEPATTEPADTEAVTEPADTEAATEPADTEAATEPADTEEATEPEGTEPEGTEPAETEPADDEKTATAKADIKHYAEELAAITSEDDFKAYVKNYVINVLGKKATDADTAADGVLVTGASYSESSDAMKWAFEAKAGESTVIESNDGKTQTVYVLVSEKARDDNDGNRTVRHVLFKVETAADDATDEEKAEAEAKAAEVAAKAKEVYDAWVADGATEEGITALAGEYSEDAGSNQNGGLYEDVTKGKFVEPFNSWLFDPARKEGDHDLFESTYGWHIAYYIKAGEPQWKATLTSKLKSDAYTQAKEDAKEKYPVTTYDDKIEVDA